MFKLVCPLVSCFLAIISSASALACENGLDNREPKVIFRLMSGIFGSQKPCISSSREASLARLDQYYQTEFLSDLSFRDGVLRIGTQSTRFKFLAQPAQVMILDFYDEAQTTSEPDLPLGSLEHYEVLRSK
jgi:hypothetical protein